MDSFSWSDALRACLPCMARPAIELDDEQQQQPASRAPRPSLSAREELERLLETDDEAETLSLHSNMGGQRRPKKGKARRGGRDISLFGYSLFGRRTGAVALPDSDDEGGPRIPQPRRSSSTLDSDAAPIDDSAIANLSWDAAREAEERERAERRAARRHRKEMKRAAAALAAGVGEDEFEGFPGSGSYLPAAHSQSQEFGAFVQAPTPPPSEPPQHQHQHDQVPSNDDDEADFGAELYTRKTGSSVRSGSDTRSSASSGGRRKKSAKSSTSASSRSRDELRSPPPALSFSDVAAVASNSPSPHLQQTFTHPGMTPSPKTAAFPSTGFGRPSGGASGLSAASFSAALGRSGNDA